MSGDIAMVGAPGDDHGSVVEAGSAYYFNLCCLDFNGNGVGDCLETTDGQMPDVAGDQMPACGTCGAGMPMMMPLMVAGLVCLRRGGTSTCRSAAPSSSK